MRAHTKPYVLLEITPHDATAQTPLMTEEFINILHATATPKQHFLFFFEKSIYSFEIHAAKLQGIRFILRVPKSDVSIITKSFYSYLPTIAIKEIDEYLPMTGRHVTLANVWYGFCELTLSNHFAFPLKPQRMLSQHDPIASITAAMSQLSETDMVAAQLVLSPITKHTHPRTATLIQSMIIGLLKDYDMRHFFKRSILQMFHDAFSPHQKTLQNKIRLTTGERKLYQDMQEKLEEPLFEANLRLFAACSTRENVNVRIQGFLGALSSFNTAYQSLIAKKSLFLLRRFDTFFCMMKFQYRMFSLFGGMILSSTEVSSIYHVPYMKRTKTEGLLLTKSKVLPISLPMLQNAEKFSITLGKNAYGQQESSLGLTHEERQRHMYIVGATGTGKTTLLLTMIVQDIQKGRGVCVIDPHGDLITNLLRVIPSFRSNDVILFDPSDINFPIGLNLLDIASANNEDLEREKDMVASHLVSIFSKLSQARYWGQRMENVLRIATLTALVTEHPTLFTIQRILLDYRYRKTIVETLTDPTLLLFWKKEFASLGSYQKASVTAPITNKLGRFLTAPHTKYILSQYRSTIDFSTIMDSGKILLCNVSKGKIGEDTSALLGALVLSKIQLASLKRAEQAEDRRQDFYVYIDEFQNFATITFAEILSEARKYRLNAILAHQTISQIEDKDLLKVILANTGTIVSFRTSSPFDQDIILPMLSDKIAPSDLGNLPVFQFYLKVNAITPQDVCSGEVLPAYNIPKTNLAGKIKDYSREQFTVPKEVVEKQIQEETKSLFYEEAKKQTKRTDTQKSTIVRATSADVRKELGNKSKNV